MKFFGLTNFCILALVILTLEGASGLTCKVCDVTSTSGVCITGDGTCTSSNGFCYNTTVKGVTKRGCNSLIGETPTLGCNATLGITETCYCKGPDLCNTKTTSFTAKLGPSVFTIVLAMVSVFGFISE